MYSPLDLDDGYPFGGRETGNLLWALHALWLRWTHSLDEDFARSRLFPLLEGAANFHLHLLQPGEDGLLHLPPTYSPEYAPAPDCSYDLSLLRWALTSLLELEEALSLNAPRAQVWRDTLRGLAPRAGPGVTLSLSYTSSETPARARFNSARRLGGRKYLHLYLHLRGSTPEADL